MNIKVLVIEDELHTADTITAFLEKEGYECRTAHDGDLGLLLLLHQPFDVAIIDWMLPGLNGLEICKIAKKIREIKVIMLSAKTSYEDKVAGLEIGADDYIGKPFGLYELNARIRRLLRTKIQTVSKVIEYTPKQTIRIKCENNLLELNDQEKTVFFNQCELSLTLVEFSILYLLASRTGQVVTRKDCVKAIGDEAFTGELHHITVHVSNLRTKFNQQIEYCPIKTVYGIGYKLDGILLPPKETI